MIYNNYYQTLYHSGVKDMRWGVRRYQNTDGSLTMLGRIHYGVGKPRSLVDRNGKLSDYGREKVFNLLTSNDSRKDDYTVKKGTKATRVYSEDAKDENGNSLEDKYTYKYMSVYDPQAIASQDSEERMDGAAYYISAFPEVLGMFNLKVDSYEFKNTIKMAGAETVAKAIIEVMGDEKIINMMDFVGAIKKNKYSSKWEEYLSGMMTHDMSHPEGGHEAIITELLKSKGYSGYADINDIGSVGPSVIFDSKKNTKKTKTVTDDEYMRNDVEFYKRKPK